MYLEIILLLLHFTSTVVASLKIRKRLILKKLLWLPALFQHFCFRLCFRFQPLSSKRFRVRFHKKLTASASSSRFHIPGFYTLPCLDIFYRVLLQERTNNQILLQRNYGGYRAAYARRQQSDAYLPLPTLAVSLLWLW